MINMELIWACLLFICNAVVGGIAYIYFRNIKKRATIIRHIILSAIAGYIYYIAYRNYSLPDSLVAVVIGWFAPDFIASIMEKYKPKSKTK